MNALKKGFFFIMTSILFVSSSAFGSGDDIIWKSGTVVPQGIGFSKQIEGILVPGLKAATDGKLIYRVYYGGVMGDEEAIIQKIRAGQLQSCGVSVQGSVMACPEMGVLALPFMFNDYGEVDYVKDKMWRVFDELMAKRGLKLILWLDQGFDQIYSTRLPLGTLEEFPNAKFITWCGAVEEKIFEKMNTSPIQVGIPEFNSTIRMGLADCFIGPAIWSIGTQLYAQLKYINTTNIRYSPGICIVSVDVWNALPAKYQENISKNLGKWQKEFCDDARISEAKAMKALLGYQGIKEVKMDPETLSQFRKRTEPVWQEMVGVQYPKEILDMLLAHLQEYRAKKTGK
jgi:TRAP-type C4-dicarboxylate transport system substrate-binding protein